MTTVDRDPEFRDRLVAAYQAGDLGVTDFTVRMTIDSPKWFLSSLEHCRSLLFGLELAAAFSGQPHPAIQHVKINPFLWPYQRMSTNSDDAVTALFLLSQSPFGSEFAEDTHQLRPRLFAIAQRHAVDYAATQVPST